MTRPTLSIAVAVIAISPLAAHSAVNVTSFINNDTTSTIHVIQAAALTALLERSAVVVDEPVSVADGDSDDETAGNASHRSAGYRVQVFSDNNQRTAKGEARSKEMQIKEAFPEYGTYIVYNSPFWRLKVGDFKTQHEAEAAADAIKSRFPSFAREVRVVRDRVNARR
ncbi:MAG: SPOR domain-containing protein [Muribaculaceae bacterium]|nr:SPOR domain-containing protein [Muribaculaceae bacterium]